VKLGEICVHNDTLVLGLGILFIFSHGLVGLSSIHEEVLRSGGRLSDNVANVEGLGGDVDGLPGLSIVPSELNILCGLGKLGRHDQSAVVGDIVNIVTCVRR